MVVVMVGGGVVFTRLNDRPGGDGDGQSVSRAAETPVAEELSLVGGRVQFGYSGGGGGGHARAGGVDAIVDQRPAAAVCALHVYVCTCV